MQRNQRTYIFSLDAFKLFAEYHFLQHGILVFESDLHKTTIEVIECCLGNATRDNLAKCQRNIYSQLPQLVDTVAPDDLSAIINILCNELEATHLHTMRMEADQEPTAFCFTYDEKISRLTVTSECLPINNGWVDHRAYSYEMQTYLNGARHEPVQQPYSTGFDFCWRAV